MATVGEIREHLIIILNQVAETQNIINCEVHPNIDANYGDGFAAQFYTGEIRDKETGKSISVGIKKAPNFNFDFDYNPLFRNEDLFYSLLLPTLDKLQREMGVSDPFDNVPKYCCSSLESKNEYIAMTNLKPFGYVMFDKTQYLGKDHLEKLFKIYGKYHALSYVLRSKDLEKYQEIAKEFSDMSQKMTDVIGSQLKSAISAAVNSLDSNNDKVAVEELKDFGENVINIFFKACTYNGNYRCFVHGDCWSNNMLFKYSETGELLDIKLIDFQLCRDNTPIHDLSYFFYSGASKEDLDNLDKYLEIYHQSFSDFAKQLGSKPEELFTFDVLRQEWKNNALFGVIMGIYVWQIKFIPKEKLTGAVDPTQQEKASMDDTIKLWDTLMSKVHEKDEYRERSTAVLRHAVEYGVLNKDKIVKNK